MPLKFVRNDITLMQTDAIVNTANPEPIIGVGTDTAVYNAAGKERLLAARRAIGPLREGDVVLTPGFGLRAAWIIHAVSPKYIDGRSGEEEKLRACYRKSLQIASARGFKSVAFPLIASGNYGYPREEAFRIAMDELTRYLLYHDMLIYMVLFDEESVDLVEKIYPELEEYISRYDVEVRIANEYNKRGRVQLPISLTASEWTEMERLLAEDRMNFADYLMKTIDEKGLKNSAVYREAFVSKQTFSKIQTDPSYHPKKLTALCLAVGAKMSFPEAVRLLSLAGYSFSEYDRVDIIFSYFIRHHRTSIYEIRAALERYGIFILSIPE